MLRIVFTKEFRANSIYVFHRGHEDKLHPVHGVNRVRGLRVNWRTLELFVEKIIDRLMK